MHDLIQQVPNNRGIVRRPSQAHLASAPQEYELEDLLTTLAFGQLGRREGPSEEETPPLCLQGPVLSWATLCFLVVTWEQLQNRANLLVTSWIQGEIPIVPSWIHTN